MVKENKDPGGSLKERTITRDWPRGSRLRWYFATMATSECTFWGNKKIGFPKKTSERSTTGDKFTSNGAWRPGVIRPG